MARIYIDVYTVTLTLDLLLWLKNYGLVYNGTLTFDILPWGEDNGTSLGHWRQLSDSEIYSPKNVVTSNWSHAWWEIADIIFLAIKLLQTAYNKCILYITACQES